jgi:DNA invertase Pin-like site-specific DNA recombinase
VTVFGLIRVSEPESGRRGYSPAEQRVAIEALATREGLRVTEWAADLGVSGQSYRREGLDRARALAEQGALSHLLLLNVSRFSRRTANALRVLEWFTGKGVRVLFAEHASGGTPAGDLQVGILASFAQYQLEETRQRTRAARRSKAEAGKVPNHFQLYGYRLIQKWEEQADPLKAGKAGTLEVIEAEAQVVRLVFQLAEQGLSLYAITRELTARGCPTKRGGQWTACRVRNLLRQPAYIGQLAWCAHEHRLIYDEDRAAPRRRVTPAAPVVIPCPPILTTADGAPDVARWERVQARRRDGFSPPGREAPEWTLRGLCVCGDCPPGRLGPRRIQTDRRSHGGTRRAYTARLYKCGGCGATWDAPRLEALARRTLARRLAAGVPEAVAREQAQARQRQARDVAGDVAARERDLRQVDEEERGVARMLAAGIAPHIVTEQIQALHRRRADLQAELRRLREQAERGTDPEAAARQAGVIAARLREELAAATGDPERLRALFRRVLRVTLRRGKPALIEVTLPGL